MYISSALALLSADSKASAVRMLRIRNAARTKFDTTGVDFSGHAVDVNMDNASGSTLLSYGRVERLGVASGRGGFTDVTGPVPLQARDKRLFVMCSWYDPVDIHSAGASTTSQLGLFGFDPIEGVHYYKFGPRRIYPLAGKAYYNSYTTITIMVRVL